MSFIDYFTDRYHFLLGKRFDTFCTIFKYLESQNKEFYSIVETGMARQPGNYGGDGMSTLLFDKFISHHDGEVRSVDLDKNAIKLCKPLVSKKTKLFQGDSVEFLFNLSSTDIKIDLLYLDSFDIDWSNPHPSAFHHMKEMLAIMPKIKPSTLIVVDDNLPGVGKGQYVREFMDNIGKKPYFDEYQVGWIW